MRPLGTDRTRSSGYSCARSRYHGDDAWAQRYHRSVPAISPLRASSDSLSAREAVRIALKAQGLRGPRLPGGPGALISHLRGIQLDTISVLARSHELVAYARLGGVARKKIEGAYRGPRSDTFEYCAH